MAHKERAGHQLLSNRHFSLVQSGRLVTQWTWGLLGPWGSGAYTCNPVMIFRMRLGPFMREYNFWQMQLFNCQACLNLTFSSISPSLLYSYLFWYIFVHFLHCCDFCFVSYLPLNYRAAQYVWVFFHFSTNLIPLIIQHFVLMREIDNMHSDNHI